MIKFVLVFVKSLIYDLPEIQLRRVVFKEVNIIMTLC